MLSKSGIGNWKKSINKERCHRWFFRENLSSHLASLDFSFYCLIILATFSDRHKKLGEIVFFLFSARLFTLIAQICKCRNNKNVSFGSSTLKFIPSRKDYFCESWENNEASNKLRCSAMRRRQIVSCSLLFFRGEKFAFRKLFAVEIYLIFIIKTLSSFTRNVNSNRLWHIPTRRWFRWHRKRIQNRRCSPAWCGRWLELPESSEWLGCQLGLPRWSRATRWILGCRFWVERTLPQLILDGSSRKVGFSRPKPHPKMPWCKMRWLHERRALVEAHVRRSLPMERQHSPLSYANIDKADRSRWLQKPLDNPRLIYSRIHTLRNLSF